MGKLADHGNPQGQGSDPQTLRNIDVGLKAFPRQ